MVPPRNGPCAELAQGGGEHFPRRERSQSGWSSRGGPRGQPPAKAISLLSLAVPILTPVLHMRMLPGRIQRERGP